MPRQKRKISESKTYHVMVRGNERKKIFLDNEDHEKFIDILCKKVTDENSILFAFCLMDNHVHMVIDEGYGKISVIMQKINLCYACYFNKKYGRVGHLFQDRFKSEVIENDAYLLTAIRYVHNNPVKANITNNPNGYSWSSCSAYFNGNRELLPLHIDYILELFSIEKSAAIDRFIDFTNLSNNDEFIEIPEDIRLAKSIFTEKEAQEFMLSYLSEYKLNTESIRCNSNRAVRNKLINCLKKNSTLTIKQIADILSVDRNIVQRA